MRIWEHELKGRIGIHHNIVDNDGVSIWLKIDRLKRKNPPPIPESIQEWMTVGNDPENHPQQKDKLIKTLTEQKAEELVSEGVVLEDDVSEPLSEQIDATNMKDVIFRLENNPQIRADIGDYLKKRWLPWSETEKPRRETIRIYESLFSLQQTIEAQADEQPIELTWGIGIGRWKCDGHTINHPLLEKPIEIEVDSTDGAILIHPRNIDPIIVLGAYSALGRLGVDVLSRLRKNHLAEMSKDIEFSPYIPESFESVLRQAATELSEGGTYWPNINPDMENRQPNTISDSLEITDSWVIFAKPRSSTAFIQDIERFKKKLENLADEPIPNPAKKLVTELSDESPLPTSGGVLPGGDSPASSTNTPTTKPELFFPKASNAQQIQIIDRLEGNDGVVVQGPPGTGKTHTIANIICHYLATGRRVLVTSKGEPALSVLQEQIPEELRNLTISLLTNERQGMKQIEDAVSQLSYLVSQTNLDELTQGVETNVSRVRHLEQEIRKIDEKIKKWGLKQLNPVGERLTGVATEMTAMELAKLVMDDDTGDHDWLPDKLGSSDKYTPRFTDSDIAKIRNARHRVGASIVYVGKTMPSIQDMPDSANIAAIHNDLSKSAEIAQDLESGRIPPLAVAVDNTIERAKQIKQPLQDCSELLGQFENDHGNRHGNYDWLKPLYCSWIDNIEEHENGALFDKLLSVLSTLMEQRQQFVTIHVELPDPSACLKNVTVALTNCVNGRRAFGLLSFGNSEEKTIIEQARIDGETPTNAEQWQRVLDYTIFQDDVRKFIIRWNHVGQEIGLPPFVYGYGDSLTAINNADEWIKKAKRIASKYSWLRQEVSLLFPYGIDTTRLGKDKSEIDKTIEAIELNISRISLDRQRLRLQDLVAKLQQSDGEITEKIKNFVTNRMGDMTCTSNDIIQEWQQLIAELSRINTLAGDLQVIENMAGKISDSGAPDWCNSLKTEPLLETSDNLTPDDWLKTWQWKQRKQYLHEIDGRDKLKTLSEKRTDCDNTLKKTFSELVRLKTNIGLHRSMTKPVQSALVRFAGAIGRIGKGSGKRAPRHRRDAYRAMQACYAGVPCWIMPTWRVSESMPSDFGSFDLVIIDEASQSDITALPTILRAKKLLIVGDDKQVSPTAAFVKEDKMLQLNHNFLKDQPFEECLLPGVSIYDLANAVFPGERIMLTEHFRCVEPIIRFSMQFYNDQLIPLRIPKSSEKLTPPLVDVYVKGGHRDERRNINELEAEAIVAEIKVLVGDPKYNGRSIGIVSLIGKQQAKYIQDKLLNTLGEEIFQKNKIACGDAATFQGKERDIMFLSMVVGTGQGAVMIARSAEQRMNVALSRARDRMYLYRSVQETDLTNESDLRLKILRHFKNPMAQQEQVDNPVDLCGSPFEKDVYNRLIAIGYDVIPQVKVGAFSIDLVVEGENDRRLAVELDGDQYHQDWMKDWERQRTMERVGWKFWRCWGSSYTIDPEGCIDDLVKVLDSMEIRPCESSSSANIYTEQRVYQPKPEMGDDGLDFESVTN